MSQEHLQAIREYELRAVLPYLNQSHLILEIGSGNGWQARLMTQFGLNVFTLDLPGTSTINDIQQMFFDGIHFPLQDASVDVVYTSNVLEHISELQSFQKEIRRVLRPNGIAIHVLPTGTWRWWTSCGFYISKFQSLSRKNRLQGLKTKAFPTVPVFRLRYTPVRHGTLGNSFTELYSFSRGRWSNIFRTFGWKIDHLQANRLFYTGYSILDKRLSLKLRHYLSYFMGSSCVIYVLR